MKRPNAGRRHLQRRQSLGRASGHGRLDFFSADGERARRQFQAVEFFRIMSDRRVAVPADVGQDIRNNSIDIVLDLAVRADKAGERILETGFGRIQPKRHQQPL